MLRIGGLAPLSATDFPGLLSAVVFCQGCAWQCAYCHNPHLRHTRSRDEIAWPDIQHFLERRQGLLDAVVFSGGEPTTQHALIDAIHAVKALGFRVGLHTGGAAPARLRAVLPLLDWVGMDIKAPFADYAVITGIAGSGAKAMASARALVASGVSHEFRTTVHHDLLSADALTRIADDLVSLGARRYVVQEFRGQGCPDAELATRPLPPDFIDAACAGLDRRFADFSVRRA